MRWRSYFAKAVWLIAPVIFLQSLFFKFSSAPESVYIFTKVGMEPWGRYMTGGLELIASVLFFIPGWNWLGALLAIDVMIGAIFSHLTLLGVVVHDDSGLLFGMAVAVFLSSSFTLYQNRYFVPGIGGLLKQSDELALSYDSNFKPTVGHRLPIVIILSFAGLCGLGILQQILSINFLIGSQSASLADIRIAQWSYFLTLISVFFTFLLTLFVLRLFEKPLHELIAVCRRISQGDLSTRSNLPLKSEFGILSSSMNQMLENIQNKENELSEKSLNIQRLLRVVIHDVANPLMVINFAAKAAMKNSASANDEQSKHWSRVTVAAGRIEGVIKSTRDFEAVRSGIKQLNLKKVSVQKCLDSVMDLFRERAESKSIKFSVQNRSGIANPEILVEENLFVSSVVSNIVSNAIKFSPEGAVIEFLVYLNSYKQLVIEIVDHGVGLPAEMLQKFNSGGNVQSRLGTNGEQGTGFGLDIARSIMKSMNGDLNIQSQTKEASLDNHGTKVLLILPIEF